ncbi:unnamed protein product [Phaedon cochleariae]|uniref:Tetratricopeptide repeat protein 39B n=1 Tax=Phaedon cochleariae TaxID=80249 RepID=A0A9P0DWM9_PHACE|nr:unnamed protein product [Phaedon cochleariae]
MAEPGTHKSVSDHEKEIVDSTEEIKISTEITLEKSIEECQTAVDKFFNNHFMEAKDLMRPYANVSMYHSLGHSVFLFLEALLTFDPETIETANAALRQSVLVSGSCRRKTTLTESVGNLVKGTQYDLYTDKEAHAELCHAESMQLRSVLTFIQDESLTSLVRAGIDIRSCFNSYKDCQQILLKKSWQSEGNKIHFESGVRVGIGVFNLMISLFPAKIIKLLEWIGFSGNREYGLKELNIGCKVEGIRQILAVMATLGYNLIVLYVLGHAEGDTKQCKEILQKQLAKHPESVWFLFFQGRLELILGNLEASQEFYKKSLESQSVWPQFHHMCYWELFWIHCIKFEWKNALIYVNKLCEHSNWSKSCYYYQKAAVLMMMQDELNSSESEEIDKLLKDVARYKQKIGGQSLPMEQFSIKRAERYFNQDKSLMLPILELMLVWNLFKVLKKPNIANNFLKVIEKSIAFLKSSSKHSTYDNDNKAILLLMRGTCLTYMGSPLQGMECLEEVISMKEHLVEDHYVIPYAIFELALIDWKNGKKEKAISALEDVKKNYTGYFLEARLHFRIQSALTEFKK